VIAKLLISPNLDQRVMELEKILFEEGLSNPHPDLLYIDSSMKLGIEQVRKIKQFLSFRPHQARGKGVVLENAGSLTIDAQNALLKTIEELPNNSLFILGADSEAKLLPTILSRCQLIRDAKSVKKEDTKYSQDIERLLRISLEQRFEFVERLKEREEFFRNLVSFFHEALPNHASFTQELLLAERWQKQNGNLRAILEYLMLVMPNQ
jgi:Cft2 family RNA processing exonuclease